MISLILWALKCWLVNMWRYGAGRQTIQQSMNGAVGWQQYRHVMGCSKPWLRVNAQDYCMPILRFHHCTGSDIVMHNGYINV